MTVDQQAAANEPQKPAEGSIATAPPPAATEPKELPSFLRLVRRLPFTTFYVVATLLLAIGFTTLWNGIEELPIYPDVAYGLPAFEDGRWLTLIWGNFFALTPFYYVYVAGAFAFITGFSEWMLGTKRTVILCVVYQVAAVLLTALIFLIFRHSGWEWAEQRATETDVGFSAGMLAVASVASATVRPPWRLRMRIAIWAYVLFSIMFVGQMADAEHLLAVGLSMPFSSRLAGPRARKARALPTRHELRLLAMVGVLLIATIQVLANFVPGRLTPFGPPDDDPAAWYVLIIGLAISIFIANGLRKGYRWAWWVAVVLSGLYVLLALLISALLVLIAILDPDDFEAGDLDGVPQFLAGASLYLAFLVVLILGRRAFRVPRRSKRRLASGTSQADVAKDLLHKWGGGTISWMTTWPENRHMVTADGQSYLAFRKHAGVAVALGDPIGPPGTATATINDFVQMCDKAAMSPYIFSCGRETADVTDALGWQSVQVAEDNLIDLPALQFKGKKWQDIRTALNKAPKEGVTFRMVTLADESWALVRQVEHLSQEWLGDKELPEMGFTLGGVTEALDREVKVGLAIGADGVVHGVTSWMPVYGGNDQVVGWTLDLMRRADGGFRATMEFLIASSCLYFKEQGASYVSLSGAPLAKSHEDPEGESVVEKFLDTLGATLEPVYGFRSLHNFKAKFQPRLSPMYMVFRDEGDLPRIGIAITRAYLPTAGVRDMIAVVKH
ncbi:MAG: phosphatidylglycerol lysyltransferase domain-containing protein [Nakamurella sp.]